MLVLEGPVDLKWAPTPSFGSEDWFSAFSMNLKRASPRWKAQACGKTWVSSGYKKATSARLPLLLPVETRDTSDLPLQSMCI